MARYDGDIAMTVADGITLVNGQPAMERGLATAVTQSLWTRSGWWGDMLGGSARADGLDSLWREPLNARTAGKAADIVRQALAWMIDSRVAEDITVETEVQGESMLAIAIEILKPGGSAINIRYQINWQGQAVSLEVA